MGSGAITRNGNFSRIVTALGYNIGMSIFSAGFACFLLILGVLYFLLPKKIQWIVLLAGNLFFYTYSGYRNLIYIIGCTFFTWAGALLNDKISRTMPSGLSKEERDRLRESTGRKKKAVTAAVLILTLGTWIVLKYGRFLLDSVHPLVTYGSSKKFFPSFAPLVPLGMSFYTFDAVGYMLDVSRGKYRAEKNFFRYMTFITYFPHIIQGPFSRFDELGKTLFTEHRFSYDRLCQGAARMLWGYFKKLIIADKLGISVAEIFANYQNYYGIHMIAVMILYGIQIYADFSGYMDIVAGISNVLGISLEENFRQPYFSGSIDEFWRRWHITLGAWFRDYLFFPISRSAGARKIRSKYKPEVGKVIVSFIAMFWVWSSSGLWHGANWTFLIWGWLNMAVMLFSQIADPWYEKVRNFFRISLKSKVWNFFRSVRTFLLVCFLFFITRSDSLTSAGQMLKHIFSGFNRKLIFKPLELLPKLRTQDAFIILAGVVMLTVVDVLCDQGKWESVKEKTPFPIRDLIYTLMIFMIILFAGSGENIAANFIYANF